MKKHLVLGALAVLALAACTKSEVVEINKSNEITLSATTGKNLTKATDGYCNSVKPEDFQVWAATQGKTYFADQKYKKSGTSYIADGAARYWPDGAVDFFAAKNHNGTANFTYSGTTALKFEGYTVKHDVDKQTDFIYAVKKGATKSSTATPLNFRHALSQIEFQAKNANQNIYVYIDGVQVVNVKNAGTFTMTDATEDQFIDPDLDDTDNDTRTNRGVWTAHSGNDTYAVEFSSPIAVPYGSSATKLTNTTSDQYTNYSMYLLPQTLDNVWGGKTSGPASTSGKTYFVVSALIYNVAVPGSFNPSTDVVLWGDNSTGSYKPKDIAVQVDPGMEWKDGFRYVYTFNFTNYGVGGTDPGTGADVLTPITLTVTVDDFVDAGNTDVEVK